MRVSEKTGMLLPVILCGGSGTRLWPLSRESQPKQFLALTSEQTMLQQTALRLRHLSSAIPQASGPLVVCNEEHRFLAATQLMEAGISPTAIILEPVARSTAPALTIAALHANSQGSDPVMLAMPADHLITDLDLFHEAISAAYHSVCRGVIVTFGVTPQYAEAGYGYIRCHLDPETALMKVLGFTEKPHQSLAAEYVKSGTHLWNSGLFMLRASAWLSAVGKARPDILEICQQAMLDARHDLDFIRPDLRAFTSCPSESIDYAVLEKVNSHPEWALDVYVARLQAGWSDVGAWDALWRASARDENGNAVIGVDVLHHGCKDSLLMSTSRLVAGVGLENLIVVETSDAVLVMSKSCTQGAKHVVSRLSEKRHPLAQQNRKVHRPWGWYDRIDTGDRFQVKRISVNPGASLSLQVHYQRAEHWVVVKGVAEVTRGDECFQLRENESTYIPVGKSHRLKNPGTEKLEIIEIQSGTYFGEDDIVRFDDVYGRVTQAD